MVFEDRKNIILHDVGGNPPEHRTLSLLDIESIRGAKPQVMKTVIHGQRREVQVLVCVRPGIHWSREYAVFVAVEGIYTRNPHRSVAISSQTLNRACSLSQHADATVMDEVDEIVGPQKNLMVLVFKDGHDAAIGKRSGRQIVRERAVS